MEDYMIAIMEYINKPDIFGIALIRWKHKTNEFSNGYGHGQTDRIALFQYQFIYEIHDKQRGNWNV